MASLVTIEILSRLNSPRGTLMILGPKASMDIKVRAIPVVNSRLFSKDPRTSYLINSDGVTIGIIVLIFRFNLGVN